MWLSPWDNDVHGGNQLAHSLWAFSTGGAFGSGPGWGDPAMIPAGNTDLVLPAIVLRIWCASWIVNTLNCRSLPEA
jgi:cell division protein FtsW (lipid II flippase)